MMLHRGAVVLVRFPCSRGEGGKVRPALVVQSDQLKQRLSDTIVALLTTRTDRAHREPTQLLIDPDEPKGRKSGLLGPSAVRLEKRFTIDQQIVFRVIGQLPPGLMRQVDACLKAALGWRGSLEPSRAGNTIPVASMPPPPGQRLPSSTGRKP